MLLGSPSKNLRPNYKLSWDIFEISPFSGQNKVNQGGRGGPRNLIFIGILLKIQNHMIFWDIFEISPFSGQTRVNLGGTGGL